MALLDVSDVLTDPDFTDATLVCARNTQTVGSNGRATDASQSIKFAGVVTMDKGAILNRVAEGSYVDGSILIHTKFLLRMNGANVDADVVTRKGKPFTVTAIGDYSDYGRGFVWAVCEPVRLAG